MRCQQRCHSEAFSLGLQAASMLGCGVCVCVCVEGGGEGGKERKRKRNVSVVSYCKDTNCIIPETPPLRILFNLNYLFKGPISKYSHTGLPHMSSVDIKFSPKHDTINSLSFFLKALGWSFSQYDRVPNAT